MWKHRREIRHEGGGKKGSRFPRTGFYGHLEFDISLQVSALVLCTRLELWGEQSVEEGVCWAPLRQAEPELAVGHPVAVASQQVVIWVWSSGPQRGLVKMEIWEEGGCRCVFR